MRMGTFKQNLGPALRTLRVRAGLSQRELGVAVGLHQTWISRFERGRGHPSFEIIDSYLGATGSTSYELMDGIYQREPDPDEIAERILGLLRLGPLSRQEREEALGKIRQLRFELRISSAEEE